MAPSTQRTAIVTGSSRDIGAAIAERLASDGFNVIVNYSGKSEDANALTARIVAAGGRRSQRHELSSRSPMRIRVSVFTPSPSRATIFARAAEASHCWRGTDSIEPRQISAR